MAATPVPLNTISRTPLTEPAQVIGDPANGHNVSNGGRTWLEVQNADNAATHTVTVNIPKTVDGQGVIPKAYAVPASATQRILLGLPEDYGTLTSFTVDSAQLKFRAFTV